MSTRQGGRVTGRKATPARRGGNPTPGTKRSCRWIAKPSPGGPGMIRLTVGKISERYRVEPQRAQGNDLRAFTLQKSDGVIYRVRQSHAGKWLCNCKGFSGHQRCKHASAMPILLDRLGGRAMQLRFNTLDDLLQEIMIQSDAGHIAPMVRLDYDMGRWPPLPGSDSYLCRIIASVAIGGIIHLWASDPVEVPGNEKPGQHPKLMDQWAQAFTSAQNVNLKIKPGVLIS